MTAPVSNTVGASQRPGQLALTGRITHTVTPQWRFGQVRSMSATVRELLLPCHQRAPRVRLLVGVVRRRSRRLLLELRLLLHRSGRRSLLLLQLELLLHLRLLVRRRRGGLLLPAPARALRRRARQPRRLVRHRLLDWHLKEKQSTVQQTPQQVHAHRGGKPAVIAMRGLPTWHSGQRALTCSHAAMHSCSSNEAQDPCQQTPTPDGKPAPHIAQRRDGEAESCTAGGTTTHLVEVVPARKLPQKRRRHHHVLRRGRAWRREDTARSRSSANSDFNRSKPRY